MSNPQPTPDPRPDLRLVGDAPPVDWRVPRYSVQRADLPPDPARCCLGSECPGCADDWPAVDWDGLEVPYDEGA